MNPPTQGSRHPKRPTHINKKKATKKIKTQENVGNAPWATKSQFEYLSNWLDDFTSMEPKSQERKVLVKNVVILFLTKYGWDYESSSAPEELADPDEDELPELNRELLGDNASEIAERQDEVKKFRQRLGNWYRHHSRKLVQPSIKNPLAPSRLLQEAVLPPRKPRVDHVYNELYFESHVRSIYEQRKQEMIKNNVDFDPLVFRDQVVAEMYRLESQEVLDEVQGEVDERFVDALIAYKKFMKERPSDSNLTEALENAAGFLQPVVDRVADMYGWTVTMVLSGVIPGTDVIELKSLHAGGISGAVLKQWPDNDPAGWQAASESFMKFASKVHAKLTSAPEHAESSDQPAVTRPKPKPRTVKSAALPPPPAKSPTASLSSQELPTPAPPLGPMVVPATSAAAAPAPAPHSSLPRIPDGASAWLADFSDYIIQDLGPQWNQLLSVFLEHERLAGFPERGKALPATSRPAAIGEWSKRKRIKTNDFIDDKVPFPAFAEGWLAWWAALQDPARPPGASRTNRELDWSKLNFTGLNGFFNLVIGLLWWGIKVVEDDNNCSRWLLAVEDVIWVLECLNDANRTGSIKRTPDGGLDATPSNPGADDDDRNDSDENDTENDSGTEVGDEEADDLPKRKKRKSKSSKAQSVNKHKRTRA